MSDLRKRILAATTGLFILCGLGVSAQTDGEVRLEATLANLAGNGSEHWTVVWVTTAAGTFIKTLWKQGPSSFTTSHWDDHCSVWYGAKGSNNAFDGFTSATAPDYGTPNSPVELTWDCRDASGQLVPDGDYKFWIQYAEDDDSNDGPHTINGLPWTKGSTGGTTEFPDQPAPPSSPRFSALQVTWTPVAPPVITSVQRSGANLLMDGTGPASEPYSILSTDDPGLPVSLWSLVGSGSFDASGHFSDSAPITPGEKKRFYLLRVP